MRPGRNEQENQNNGETTSMRATIFLK